MSIEQLAEGVQASPTYMAKLLQQLARAGLVEAHRGRGGGYSLGRPAESITLWEVVAALHGNLPLETVLLPICSRCPLAPACPLRETLASMGEEIRRRLEEVTVGGLAKLLKQATRSASSREASTPSRSRR